jgi:hypothetical protein
VTMDVRRSTATPAGVVATTRLSGH